jgi:hypothetical protein
MDVLKFRLLKEKNKMTYTTNTKQIYDILTKNWHHKSNWDKFEKEISDYIDKFGIVAADDKYCDGNGLKGEIISDDEYSNKIDKGE